MKPEVPGYGIRGTGYKLKVGGCDLCRADGVLGEASELRGSGEWLGGEVEGWVDWVLPAEQFLVTEDGVRH